MLTYYYLVYNNQIQPYIYLYKNHNNEPYYLKQNQTYIKSFTTDKEVYVDDMVFIEHNGLEIKDIHLDEPKNLDWSQCYSTDVKHNVYEGFNP